MSLENKKKIAVLGHIRDFYDMNVDDSMQTKLHHIKNDGNCVQGIIFTDYILLDEWHRAYSNPKEILSLVINRTVKFP